MIVGKGSKGIVVLCFTFIDEHHVSYVVSALVLFDVEATHGGVVTITLRGVAMTTLRDSGAASGGAVLDQS